MAFNNITNADPFDATKAMQNWRNVNYGSTLLPVNSSGAAVNATIDLGSSSNAFKDGFFSGKIKIGAQPYFLADSGSAATTGRVTNIVQVENVGAFVLSSGKITVPVSGIYNIAVSCRFPAEANFEANLTLNQYNSANSLLRGWNIASNYAAGSTDSKPSSHSGAAILKMASGDYLSLDYYEASGSPSVSDVQISIMGWPS
jgi:hypothetical protein